MSSLSDKSKNGTTGKRSGEPMARSGIFRGFSELVTELGGDPYQLLNQFGVPFAALEDEDLQVPSRLMAEIWEQAAIQLDCEDFGLRIACRQDLDVTGPVKFFIQQYPNLNTLISSEWAAKFHQLQDQAEITRIEINNNIFTYSLDHQYLSAVPETQRILHTMGWGARMAREYLEPAPKVIGYYFRSQKPKNIDLYREVFQANLYFSQDVNCVCIDVEYFQREIKILNKNTRHQVDQYVEAYSQNTQLDLTLQIKQLIYKNLPSGHFKLPEIAELLNQTPRSVQRRLQQEGLTYQQLLNDVRKEMAVRYIKKGSHNMAELSSLLQYSTLPAFTRAFKSWFGETPSGYLGRPNSKD